MQGQHRDIDEVQQLRVVCHASARTEEHDDLLLLVQLQEGEEKEEAFVRLAHDIPLLQSLHRTELLLVVHIDVEGPGPEGYPGEVLNLGGLRGGEEHRLAVLLGEDLDDLPHLILKTDLQDAVRLVDNKTLQVLKHELGVLQMI